MLSYGLESKALLDILKLTEGAKWHREAFMPRVAKVDTEVQTSDNYYHDVITIQGPGLLCCADVRALLKANCESGTMYFSIQMPGYETSVYGGNVWWETSASLVPNQPVAIVYRGFVYFKDYLKLCAVYSKNNQYILFSGTVWYVAL